MSTRRPPVHGTEFEALMKEIDTKLANEGVSIPSRPMAATKEVSIRYRISIPIGGPTEDMPSDLREYAPLSAAISQWFRENYGDRLKINPCPGRTVVLLDGDLYTLRIPRIFGSVRFVATREWLEVPEIGRGPVTCNVVQLIDQLTPVKAAALSEEAVVSIWNGFQLGLHAAHTLESTRHKLMSIARGDVEVAIGLLMDRAGRYGESKWASLQAAEKVLKAAIDLHNLPSKWGHNLADLCLRLADGGIVFDASAEVAAIQCSPGIRYGDESCSRDEALLAHQATLQLVNTLIDAGVKFTRGLGGVRSPS